MTTRWKVLNSPVTGVRIVDEQGTVMNWLKNPSLEIATQICAEHNAHEALREVLRLAKLANEIQHAGVEVPASVWSELYQATNAATAAIKN